VSFSEVFLTKDFFPKVAGGLAMAFEEDEGSYEEAAGSESHQNDGVAVGCLGFRWSGGGVVLALRAALWMRG
jgi:hypothetical protein